MCVLVQRATVSTAFLSVSSSSLRSLPQVRGRGYSLVALVVLLVVMSIAVTVALPMWSTVVQREREEELLFRGWQYAEAIRVFQARHGRLPVQLEELYELRPRAIRQLWEDPLSESGEWQPIMARTPDGTSPGGPVQGQEIGGAAAPQVGNSGDDEDDGPTAFGASQVGQGSRNGQALGPIEGVRPTANGTALKSFLGRTEYSQWEFRAAQLGAPLVGANGVPRLPRLGARSLSPAQASGSQTTSGSPPRPVTPDSQPLRRTPDDG
jgi:type II secretory pathway pseudopilin PulG